MKKTETLYVILYKENLELDNFKLIKFYKKYEEAKNYLLENNKNSHYVLKTFNAIGLDNNFEKATILPSEIKDDIGICKSCKNWFQRTDSSPYCNKCNKIYLQGNMQCNICNNFYDFKDNFFRTDSLNIYPKLACDKCSANLLKNFK
ncbi:hypothetical protein NPX79_01255 [Spiroplasma endosymbiont of Anurida maritima]|uniref:hypothetical protein n=1 Tax=Spiroplasma endosymbiont of Anurida maritima TaxID=2967972 RepID=UPI0036D23A0D